MTSLGKEIVDSRVLGRDRHQVVQDYHVSYSKIEVVITVQVHRRAHDFLQKFEEVTKEPYSYLIVDLKPETPEWRRLCTNVFEKEASDDMQINRTIPVEDIDSDQMDTLEDDILLDQSVAMGCRSIGFLKSTR
jgi:hypothetical protein